MNAINQAGIDLIKEYEGLRLKPYTDAAGHPSIGYGHLIQPHEHFSEINEQQATVLLCCDIAKASRAVNEMVSVPLNENQHAALTSFVFNVGSGNFRKSELRSLINRKDFLGAANEFPRWIFAGGKKLKGLENRRTAERLLFIRPVLEVNN